MITFQKNFNIATSTRNIEHRHTDFEYKSFRNSILDRNLTSEVFDSYPII